MIDDKQNYKGPDPDYKAELKLFGFPSCAFPSLGLSGFLLNSALTEYLGFIVLVLGRITAFL